MHPPPSIIVFTTLSGAGFGMIFWLGLGLGPGDAAFAWSTAVIALALGGAGLVASTFHLGHPERAWRALSQWRSSWLSREGVLAPAALAVFAVYALVWATGGGRPAALGLAASALSLATVVATAMIYGQLRTVPRWRTPLTPAAFLGFAASSGALTAAAIAAGATGSAGALGPAALVCLALAWAIKAAWRARAEVATRSSAGGSPEAATGLGGLGRVRLFEAPHTGGNYLLREMVFVVGRRRARALWLVAVAAGAAGPALVGGLAMAGYGAGLWGVAAVLHLAGLLAERWLFFAEAEHVVGAYYGRR